MARQLIEAGIEVTEADRRGAYAQGRRPGRVSQHLTTKYYNCG